MWRMDIVTMEIPPVVWGARMILGCALLTLCIFIHTLGLIMIARLATHERVNLRTVQSIPFASAAFAVCASGAAVLFVVQAFLWGMLYVHLGAINGFEHAISFSIGAFTTYGGSGIVLGRPWVLLSEIQAVNGVIAFGLTTAFLFTLGNRMFPKP